MADSQRWMQADRQANLQRGRPVQGRGGRCLIGWTQRGLRGEQEVAAECGGGVQEVEINLQATPTVISLWGIEMCVCGGGQCDPFFLIYHLILMIKKLSTFKQDLNIRMHSRLQPTVWLSMALNFSLYSLK